MKNKQLKGTLSKLSSGNLLSASRILIFTLLIATVGGVGLLFQSSATSVTVSGRVYDSRTNAGIPGVKIIGCNNYTATTDSLGKWHFSVAVNGYYCARSSFALPSGWTGPVTNQPRHPTLKSYEYQVAGISCVPTSTASVCNSTSREYDRPTDSGTDFRYTSPPPPTISSFKASPTTITVGSSSKLSWASNGTACSLAHGTSHSGVSASGSTTVKPGVTTTYTLTCSNISGNSSPKSLTITVKAATVTTQPPPTRTGGGSTSTGGTKAKPDTTPPSTPGSLTVNEDDATKTVKLSWQSSRDNVGVAGYEIDRSTDNKNWSTLANNSASSSFDDPATDFSTLYYYRVKAVDRAGNSSGYTETHITTNPFQANTANGSDTSITSDDKVATITIPAGVLTADAFCTVTSADGILPPNISGYINIAGPYQLNCRDSGGQPITNFNDALVLSVQLNTGITKGVGKVQYFGQNSDGSWQALEIQSHDKKSLVDKVKLKGFTTFSIMGQQKKHSVWLTIFEILIFLVLAFFGLRLLLRFILTKRLERQAEKLNDDYRHKSGGY